MWICKYCGKEFFDDWRIDKKYKRKNKIPYFCSRKCMSYYINSFNSHPRGKPSPLKGKPNGLKGLTKETSLRYDKVSKALKGKKSTFLGKHHTKETREKLSKIQSERIEEKGHGGFSDVLYYKTSNIEGVEFSVRGTWELKVANFLNTNNILWIRKKYLNYYNEEGIKKTYIPDFYLVDTDEYWEIKGYFSEKDKIKLSLVEKYNNITIKVLKKEELTKLNIL